MRALCFAALAVGMGVSFTLVCCASDLDAPRADTRSEEASRLPNVNAVPEPVPESSNGVERSLANDGRATFNALAKTLKDKGLLVDDELTAKGLGDLEKDVLDALASVSKRRASLDPKAPNYDRSMAVFDAMETQFVAEFADLKDGLFLTVSSEFAKHQFALQRENPGCLLVLMSPKESKSGKAIVVFGLDVEERHLALREARRLKSLAYRMHDADNQNQQPK